MPSITEILTSAEGRSAAAWARRRRHERLVTEFPDPGQMRVLARGGEPPSGPGVSPKPGGGVLLTPRGGAGARARELSNRRESGGRPVVGGDACKPPQEVRGGRF